MLMEPTAPFGPGIQYKIETTSPDQWQNHLYMGEPCDESERAWNKLIHRLKHSHLLLCTRLTVA